jgi:hypothetical protein
MTSFVDNWPHRELLNISKSHLDAIDRSRIIEGSVVGLDNHANLKVSTVFAAIAIEAALNDYVLTHCVFLEKPYLQEIFGSITSSFLRSSVQQKINLVRDNWPTPFPEELIADVRNLFRIRNRVTHESGTYVTANFSYEGGAFVRNNPLSKEDNAHMLRHHEIAFSFLEHFWLPGNRELESVRTVPEASKQRMFRDV